MERISFHKSKAEPTGLRSISLHTGLQGRMARTLLFPVLLLALMPLRVTAQYPLAAGSPHGNYIFLDNQIPKDGGFEIFRSEDKKSDFQSIGKVEAPKSLDELIVRIRWYDTLFTDMGKYYEKDIIRMWEYISQYALIDTLPPVNYPIMHLAAGTAFLDKTARKGILYKYRIERLSEGSKTSGKITEAVSWPGKPALPIPEVNSTNTDHKNVYIDWHISPDPHLYSFSVYRRQNMAGEYLKIPAEKGFYSRGDSIFMVMNDRTIRPRTSYEYFIKPLDRLGNPGAPSKLVQVASFLASDVPVLTKFNVTEGDQAHQMDLTWRYNNHDLVRSISIFRSDNWDSAFVKIAEVPAKDSLYTDNLPQAMENYYYYLVFEGIMDRGYQSAKVGWHATNNLEPDPPSNIAANPVEGGVKVYWEGLGTLATGYYVFRDQGRNDSLYQISGLIPAAAEIMTFVDSSAMLNGNLTYRYALKSINDGYVLSALSETSAARPGIKTYVISPSNLHGGFSDGKVILVWDNMLETNEFLYGYNIYRKGNDEKDYKKLNDEIMLFSENTFTDSVLQDKALFYHYAVSAIDESGSESILSDSFKVTAPEPAPAVSPPSGLRLTQGADGLYLSWSVEEDSKSGYRVYRYTAGKGAQKIADLPAGTFNYIDALAEKDMLYFYFLTAVSPAGLESERSAERSIRY